MRPSSWSAWLVLLTVALAWALGEWPAERTAPTLLLAYLPAVVWVLPAGLALLWTLLRRRGVEAALAALILAVWGAGLVHWQGQEQGNLRVLTYNVARGTLGSPAELLRVLRGTDADLILLQETNFLRPEDGEALRRGLGGYAVRQGYEVTTFSRLPVLGSETYAQPGSRRTMLETRVQVGEREVRVLNAHLGTVLVSSALRGDGERLRSTHATRAAQVGRLCELARQSSGPLLAGGDFNTPPRGQLYRRLKTCLGQGAHGAAGRGPGWTFPSLFLRIDHFFARGLRATRSTVLREAQASDHLPLLVEYRF